jgi:hypothetical protein
MNRDIFPNSTDLTAPNVVLCVAVLLGVVVGDVAS